MSFADDFDAAADKKLRWMDGVRKAAIHECCAGIIEDTPVATGDLKGSWHTRVNDPTVTREPRTDPSGELPKAENRANLGGLGDTVHFTNGLDYSETIEFDGRSKKAPEGMVRKNLAKFPTLVAHFKAGSRG